MRNAYKNLALAIPALVLVQAASIAFAVYALGAWVQDGHDLTKAGMDAQESMGGSGIGFAIHGIVGQMVIPLVALALMVVAFLAREVVPESLKWAGMMLGSVVVQVVIGMLGQDLPFLGVIHGVLALAIFGLGLRVAQQATDAPKAVSTS